MLVLPVDVPFNLESCAEDAMASLRNRMLAMTFRALLAGGAEEHHHGPGFFVDARLTLFLTKAGDLRRIKAEFAPPSDSDDGLTPSLKVTASFKVQLSSHAESDQRYFIEALASWWIRRALAFRMKEEGRELGHLPLEEIEALRDQTKRAAGYSYLLSEDLEIWTLHHATLRELTLREREGDTAHKRMHAFQKAEPLRRRLEQERRAAEAWWSEMSELDQSRHLGWRIRSIFAAEEQTVVAFRGHLRAEHRFLLHQLALVQGLRAGLGMRRLSLRPASAIKASSCPA